MYRISEKIKELREKKGWRQSDLARQLEIKQQSISRWEAGTSRPKEVDLAKLHALFPEVSLDELYKLSGRLVPSPERLLTDTLPLYNLPPAKFEKFCLDLIKSLYPEATDVRIFGRHGDKQYGIDIYAKFPDKSIKTFQCKRVEYNSKFGPQKIDNAVQKADFSKIIEKTNFKITDQFILLTKEATAKEDEAITKHGSSWHLRDLVDISDDIRRLPRPERLRIIDAYFPNQRMDFLGEPKPGPWVKPENYFNSLPGVDSFFTQDWNLVGRTKEIGKLKEYLKSDQIVAIISGRGGIGKTKILREITNDTEVKSNFSHIFFASLGIEIEPKDLEGIPENTILIADDAHDRDDLNVLINGIVHQGLKCKLMLSTRPYGLEKIKASIFSSAIATGEELILNIESLTKKEAEILAKEVLRENNGPEDLAITIAKLSKDCPLITVIAAKVLSKEVILPATLNNSKSFRRLMLSRFKDVVTAEIGDATEKPQIKKLLDLITLIQPVIQSDESFSEITKELLREDKVLIDSKIRLLEDAGILLRRGQQLRIVPDLLADYIREVACFNSNEQKSTGFADRVYKIAKGKLASNLLKNLSQLDWRLVYENGKGLRTTLLDEVWLIVMDEFKNAGIWQRKEILEMIKDIAYFQPERMLTLVRFAIDNPTRKSGLDPRWSDNVTYDYVTHKLPEILQDIAYNLDYLIDACNLLWKLAQTDKRRQNQYPEHPMRILSDLIEIKPRKPLIYTERILNLAIEWTKDPEYGLPAFEVIDHVLATETDITEFHDNKFTMRPYFVSPTQVDLFREKAIDLAFHYLIGDNLHYASRAIQTITAATSYPRGMFGAVVGGKLIKEWEKRIIEVLIKLKQIVEKNNLDPILLVEIIQAVVWQAKHGKTKAKEHSQQVLDAIPQSLGLDIVRALMDGWGRSFEEEQLSYKEREERWSEWIDLTAKKTLKKYSNSDLILFLEERVSQIITISKQNGIQAHFMSSLIRLSPQFGGELGDFIMENPTSVLSNFLSTVITYLQKFEKEKALEIARKTLKLGNIALQRQLASSFSWGLFGNEIAEEKNKSVLTELLNSPDKTVRLSSVHSLSRLAEVDKLIALQLALNIKFEGSSQIAEEVLSEFNQHGAFKIHDLSVKDIEKINNMLLDCPSIDGYYIENYLNEISFQYPTETIEFLKKRIDKTEKSTNKEYDPLPFRHEKETKFRFHETKEYEDILRQLRDWVYSDLKKWEHIHFGKDLFSMVANEFNGTVMKILNEWIESGSADKIKYAASLISEAPASFIWNNIGFIIKILERAYFQGSECFNSVRSSLGSTLISGGRSGTVGEPFPQDIEMRDKSAEVLANIAPESPAKRFFTDIHQHVLREIRREKDQILDEE
ncbi:MAG: helix-turn-helix domain-containing protein [Patescibacteria group bacterium]